MKEIVAIAILTSSAWASDSVFSVVIKDHRYIPSEIVVEANSKFDLEVDNQDATAEEFESASLNREVIIKGHSKKLIKNIGPLTSGKVYPFIGEFNSNTAKGQIRVK